ncbi:MAG: geranylgeranyl reductase family protein [Desulfobacteraceae bacterium]|nr:geranylgeranyl reductase family protein [Desulfobacteraceae bacterium]
MFDVAIIGAGPAGTAAAFDLLTRGLKVLILDKYEFPRKKACAGGITPKGYHLFKYDISSQVKRKCRTVKINPSNKTPFFIQEKKTLCYMTKREDLDLFSLNMVIEKGADFRIIKKIHSIEEKQSSVEIRTDVQSFKASYLIGADGANSVVRRFVSETRRTQQTRFYQKQFAIEADVMMDRPDQYKMEFDFSKIKKGYYWIFPKDDHVNIGIYTIDPNLNLKTQDLFEYAEDKLSNNKLGAIKGYPICTGGFNYRPDSKRILLVGDAAGMAERLLGEGIYFAVKSGQLAAWSILESNPEAEFVKELYSKSLKLIQTDLNLHHYSSKWFYKFPWISLKSLSFRSINRPFAQGYADGKTIAQILFGSLSSKK